MSDPSPLDHPELRAVDALLDQRQLEEAQRRLAELGQLREHDVGTAYLVTKLLFLRGRLEADEVTDRLHELLRASQQFPEASVMLQAAESGTLTRSDQPVQAEETPATQPTPAPAETASPVHAAHRAESLPPAQPPMPTLADGSRSPADPPAVDGDSAGPIHPSVPLPTPSDSLEVPRAPSWPPASPGVGTLPLTSLNAFGTSKPPPVDGSDSALGDLEFPLLAAQDDALPPTDRSGRLRDPEEVDSKELLLEPEAPGNTTGQRQPTRLRRGGTQARRAHASDPPTAPARQEEIEASVAHAVDVPLAGDYPARTRRRRAPPGESGVGGPMSDSLGGERAKPGGGLMSPSIPRAPGIPKIPAPADPTPSYAPRRKISGHHLERPLAAPPIHGEPYHQQPDVQQISDLLPTAEPHELSDGPAGTRYSKAPCRPEFVFSKVPASQADQPAEREARGRPSPPQLPTEPPTRRKVHRPQRPTSDWPHAPRAPQIRPKSSEFPASPEDHRPERTSLLDVAELLEEKRFTDALSALDGISSDAEHLLMRARALAGKAQHDRAFEVLERLCGSALLDPEVRAGSARLLISLGRSDLALSQARAAFEAKSDSPLVRLTLAWASIRALHHTGSRDLARDADRALAPLKGRGGPHPALTQALRACVQAQVGDPERAIGVAQRALGLDPRSPEALAAIMVASVRLHRVHDAQQAWLRLHELAPAEAVALRHYLQDAHIEVPRPGKVTQHEFAAEQDARTIWPAQELQILDEEGLEVQRDFERTCRERLSRIVRDGEDEGFPAISHIAVHVLTEHPVWCHFAPYDLSLWSLSRIRAGLGLVYDPATRLRENADDFPVVLLVGSYLGQVLCQTYSAHWEGDVTDLVEAQVVGIERCWSPFLIVADRLRDGIPIDFGIADDLKRAHPGADQWAEHVAPSVTPPSPWGVAPWPPVALIPRLGRALAYSAVSEWCRRSASGPLDGSVASLGALDAYLNLLAPPAARARPAEPWLPRASVLCGAYLGEVLRATVGGAWVTGVSDVASPEDYRVRLGSHTATPVAEIHARLTGRSALPLLDYVSKVTR